jgi:hypothetical protein
MKEVLAEIASLADEMDAAGKRKSADRLDAALHALRREDVGKGLVILGTVSMREPKAAGILDKIMGRPLREQIDFLCRKLQTEAKFAAGKPVPDGPALVSQLAPLLFRLKGLGEPTGVIPKGVLDKQLAKLGPAVQGPMTDKNFEAIRDATNEIRKHVTPEKTKELDEAIRTGRTAPTEKPPAPAPAPAPVPAAPAPQAPSNLENFLKYLLERGREEQEIAELAFRAGLAASPDEATKAMETLPELKMRRDLGAAIKELRRLNVADTKIPQTLMNLGLLRAFPGTDAEKVLLVKQLTKNIPGGIPGAPSPAPMAPALPAATAPAPASPAPAPASAPPSQNFPMLSRNLDLVKDIARIGTSDDHVEYLAWPAANDPTKYYALIKAVKGKFPQFLEEKFGVKLASSAGMVKLAATEQEKEALEAEVLRLVKEFLDSNEDFKDVEPGERSYFAGAVAVGAIEAWHKQESPQPPSNK